MDQTNPDGHVGSLGLFVWGSKRTYVNDLNDMLIPQIHELSNLYV